MIHTLGWRSLARLKMFFKIVYGLVEILLPPYIQRQVRMTRNMHPYPYISKLLQILILSFGHRAVEQPPIIDYPI